MRAARRLPGRQAACRYLGLDPRQAERHPFRPPLLFVHGHSDHTVSFMGANLYPEDVAAGIDAHPAADRLGAFCMELAEDDDDVRPYIHIEVPETLRHGATETELITVIRDHLATASADYREALVESATAGDLRARLWEAGTGPFATNAARIKHRQDLVAAAAA